ncbi:MAG: hypothetical protein R2710_18985 [Acidimicrobiales bacterium]
MPPRSPWSRACHAPERIGIHRWWWIALVFACSNILLLVVSRLTKKLIPLVALMKLTLVFPDQAPSRTKAALRQSNSRTMLRDMEAARARGETLAPPPTVTTSSSC